jgi:hypothetical protein
MAGWSVLCFESFQEISFINSILPSFTIFWYFHSSMLEGKALSIIGVELALYLTRLSVNDFLSIMCLAVHS